MTRMTRPNCAVMCNLINIHTHKHTQTIIDPPLGEDQCEWHRMTRMTGSDYEVMSNLINTHTHTYTHTHKHVRSEVFVISIVDSPLGGTMRVA